jgi:hypothetical protein
MRNFGNTHYGSSLPQFTSWKSNNARYYDQFLPKLQSKFERKRYGNKADVIAAYRGLLISMGGNESGARNASKSKGGYKAPSSFEYKTEFQKHRSAGKGTNAALDATVEYFFAVGIGAVHDPEPDVFVDGPTVEEMVQAHMESTSSDTEPSRSSGSDYQERMAERRAERQARIASGETFQGRQGQAASLDQQLEEESFFARYQTPIVIGSALALAGGAYYFFVVRD